MSDDVGALTQIRGKEPGHFRRRDELHANDLNYDLIVARCLVGLYDGQRLPDRRGRWKNLIEISNLYHRGAVNFEKSLEYRK